jgi:multiple sugar transport system permease protein
MLERGSIRLVSRFLSRLAFRLTLYISALVVLAIIYAPFYVMITTSLKDYGEVFSSPPTFFPRVVEWGNYVNIWQIIPLARYLLNSGIISLGAVAVTMTIATPAAYAISRFSPRLRAISMNAILLSTLFSDVVLLPPLFSLILFLGLMNTYYALILVDSAWATGVVIWILTPAFINIPRDLEDCANIDGCNRFQIFTKIMLPLCVPSLIAGVILVLVWAWSDFLYAFVFIFNDALRPVTSGLYLFRGSRVDAPIYWQYLMAASAVAVAPLLVAFAILQKWFKGEITLGALKE